MTPPLFATATWTDVLDIAPVFTRLVQSGSIDPDQANWILRAIEKTGQSAATMLVDLGLVSEPLLAECFAAAFDLPQATAEDWPEEALFADRLSFHFLKDSRTVPLSFDGGRLRLAMADPTLHWAAKAASLACNAPVDICVAKASQINDVIERLYGEGKTAFRQITDALGPGASADNADRLQLLANEEPIVRIVNHILDRALTLRATDIHIEPFEKRLALRYRVDGLLREEDGPPPTAMAAITSRVKILAGLDIAERRLPQDGRIRTRARGEDIDLRISTLPTPFGESLVIRLLRPEGTNPTLASLGIDDFVIARLKQAIDKPQGLMLVTGPTGSGKTTTLYALMRLLNTEAHKIITVEDPVEYQIEGINQVPVKTDIGLDFPTVLRSVLRQDPDIIMIGEIRDPATAQIAVQAAMTGHLVLSTLHTNSAAAAVARLANMGVAPYLLADTLSLAMGQRLLRRLCPECATPRHEQATLLSACRDAGITEPEASQAKDPAGCSACDHTGFHGRTAAVELLEVTSHVRELILDGSPEARIRAAAVAGGMTSLRADGLRKVLRGETALAEVTRMTMTE